MSKSTTRFYRPDNYQPEASVGYLMRNIINHVAQAVDRELAHTDLTNAQLIPLFKLYTKKASTVAELARACEIDNGATTRLLDRMEAKGLCQRVRSEQDRRVVNLELTDAGNAAASDIPRILSEVQNAHLEGFNQEEFDALQGYLRRILDNAQRMKAASQTGTPDSVTETPHD
ncbi:MAG: MarR family transcriptional regulator [Rhodoferax sp.]|uniref:MarR family winged helix-turn-helix transcriptional regulator n=1 Tax=Rhodoferax sp. TaxID=50421 RepID=UPI002ACEBF0C|nr:MarR family transcriptional regulator [Rhodoferax sp.]MDZ7892688.1 MarR family transcriptional regulator [Rhodoferax sp.]